MRTAFNLVISFVLFVAGLTVSLSSIVSVWGGIKYARMQDAAFGAFEVALIGVCGGLLLWLSWKNLKRTMRKPWRDGSGLLASDFKIRPVRKRRHHAVKRGRMFTLLSVTSLMLCVVVVAMWVLSYWFSYGAHKNVAWTVTEIAWHFAGRTQNTVTRTCSLRFKLLRAGCTFRDSQDTTKMDFVLSGRIIGGVRVDPAVGPTSRRRIGLVSAPRTIISMANQEEATGMTNGKSRAGPSHFYSRYCRQSARLL